MNTSADHSTGQESLAPTRIEAHAEGSAHVFIAGRDLHVDRVMVVTTRRELLAAMGVFVSGMLAAAAGTTASSTLWKNSEQSDQEDSRKVESFFYFFEIEEYGKALAIGGELAESAYGNPSLFARWANNLACTSVWDGQFKRAHDFLEIARRVAPASRDWWLSIVNSNLAYVRYHLGWRTSHLVRPVEQATNTLMMPEAQWRSAPWLQLWSRRALNRIDAGGQASYPLIPPFGVLARLYSKEGRFREAFESGEKDIELQGDSAQGSRIILGLIARPAREENAALRYVQEVEEYLNPSSSSAHMVALRDVIVADLEGVNPPDNFSFAGQAKSIKAVYYSWTTFADLAYLLDSDGSRNLRYEFGRRVLESYENSEYVNLEVIRRIRHLVR